MSNYNWLILATNPCENGFNQISYLGLFNSRETAFQYVYNNFEGLDDLQEEKWCQNIQEYETLDHIRSHCLQGQEEVFVTRRNFFGNNNQRPYCSCCNNLALVWIVRIELPFINFQNVSDRIISYL